MSRLHVLPLAAFLLASPAFAEKADRDKPMNIVADHCLAEQKTQTSTCTGNVIVTQGTMRIQGDKLVTRQDDDGNQFGQGAGRPVKFRTKLDNSPDWLEGEALRFDYNGKTGVLKLMDKAWVRRAQDTVTGDVITYDMSTEQYQVDSAQGGRVNITITPKKKNASAAQ
ncbi:lipopolysaccharide transport periplasmic protein LptA [Chitinilyticum litopenaei]|uniref:lipopolysaccharide transport periplasmic protein LptA n=1 Tax=Chitinilyticum litopenaei TaxID=1121276 RepID=UPI0003F5C12E|nr:lipopolysaccharide transport periplasmic protein LptA [Chitinilyticum litopenaei]